MSYMKKLFSLWFWTIPIVMWIGFAGLCASPIDTLPFNSDFREALGWIWGMVNIILTLLAVDETLNTIVKW